MLPCRKVDLNEELYISEDDWIKMIFEHAPKGYNRPKNRDKK